MRWTAFSLVLMLPVGAYSYSDDYIAAISAEIEEFSSGQFDAGRNNEWAPNAGDSADAVGGAAIDKSEFDTLLRSSLPGTFILYRKLASNQQLQIYEEYLQTGDLGKARTSVFSSVSGRKAKRRSVIQNLPTDF